MKNFIEAGATNKVHEDKIQVVKNLSLSDKEFLKEYGNQLKYSNLNKFGETKGGLGRRVAILPMKVVEELKRIDPEIFEDKKKFLKFLEQFPIFKAAENL